MQVYDNNDNELTGYYCCSLCKEVIKNKTKSTSPFLRHVDKFCSKGAQQTPITAFGTLRNQEKNENTVHISAKHSQNLKDGMIQFVCKDLRPFLAVEGEGFRAAIHAAVELGQAYPSLPKSNITKIIPSRGVIQREIENKIDLAKETVEKKLHDAYNSYGGFACTSDLWTDDHRKRHFISVIAHVPDVRANEIKSATLTIACNEVKEEIKTKEIIDEHILDVLSSYGFSADMVKSSIYFVTDRGSQFKTTDKYERANCYPHMCHNLVKIMCSDSEVDTIISDARKLVKYKKKSWTELST